MISSYTEIKPKNYFFNTQQLDGVFKFILKNTKTCEPEALPVLLVPCGSVSKIPRKLRGPLSVADGFCILTSI